MVSELRRRMADATELYELVMAVARGEPADEKEYEALRQRLMAAPHLQGRLPELVLKHATLDEVRRFIAEYRVPSQGRIHAKNQFWHLLRALRTATAAHAEPSAASPAAAAPAQEPEPLEVFEVEPEPEQPPAASPAADRAHTPPAPAKPAPAAKVETPAHPAAPAQVAVTVTPSAARPQADRPETERVREAWRKLVAGGHVDPDGTIKASLTLLRWACGHVITRAGMRYDETQDLGTLCRMVSEVARLSSNPDLERATRQVLDGSASMLEGLAHLRERAAQFGRTGEATKPDPRQAEFAANLSGAISTYLVRTLEDHASQVVRTPTRHG